MTLSNLCCKRKWKCHLHALSHVTVEGRLRARQNMEEICSFPGLNFRHQTSVSLGNALSSFSYSARQERESPVSKSLDVTKEFSQTGTASVPQHANTVTNLISSNSALPHEAHFPLMNHLLWEIAGYNSTSQNDVLPLEKSDAFLCSAYQPNKLLQKLFRSHLHNKHVHLQYLIFASTNSELNVWRGKSPHLLRCDLTFSMHNEYPAGNIFRRRVLHFSYSLSLVRTRQQFD